MAKAESIEQLEGLLSQATNKKDKVIASLLLGDWYKNQDKTRKSLEYYLLAEENLSGNNIDLSVHLEVYQKLLDTYKILHKQPKVEDYAAKIDKLKLQLSNQDLEKNKNKLEQSRAELSKQELVIDHLMQDKEVHLDSIIKLGFESNLLKERLFLDSLLLFEKEQRLQNEVKLHEITSQKNKQLTYGLTAIATLVLILLAAFYGISKRNKVIASQKQESERLLLNILPKSIAEELKTMGSVKPKKHKNCTIMFTDFVDFTKISEKLNQSELLDLINEYFTEIDNILLKHNIEKIKTIGDAYLAVSGLDDKDTSDSIYDMIYASQDILQIIEQKKEEKIKAGLAYFDIRIGIHTGMVLSGVVGKVKYAYDVWGHCVNIAARIEKACNPNSVTVSKEVAIKTNNKFRFDSPKTVTIKNTEGLECYQLLGEKENHQTHT
ncbi:MAG: adenylate/guanylate cyclase domain-containing protein [Flavobacteriales bacterium]|nr:adenylate/guanylate cyclase domain-containing protein [Flavobacteriales bacterium]